VEYTDDQYASIEASALPGVYGSWWRNPTPHGGNGFILLGALGALVMPFIIGIPLVVIAFWRVARHKYHAWLGVVIALTSVGLGLAFITGTGFPAL
jgi:hypothetical protein